MHYFKISIGIFLALAASRFVAHPPNFTSLLALSFYIPAILGIKFIPVNEYIFNSVNRRETAKIATSAKRITLLLTFINK